MKIGIVVANYYPKISKDLLNGAKKILIENKIKNFKVFTAPGVFEIPVIIAKNIKSFDAFVALGCVIKGQTPHFKFISEAVTQSIMKISVDRKKPIGNGIITCLNLNQALARSNPRKNNKGIEATTAVLSVLGIIKNELKWSSFKSKGYCYSKTI